MKSIVIHSRVNVRALASVHEYFTQVLDIHPHTRSEMINLMVEMFAKSIQQRGKVQTFTSDNAAADTLAVKLQRVDKQQAMDAFLSDTQKPVEFERNKSVDTLKTTEKDVDITLDMEEADDTALKVLFSNVQKP